MNVFSFPSLFLRIIHRFILLYTSGVHCIAVLQFAKKPIHDISLRNLNQFRLCSMVATDHIKGSAELMAVIAVSKLDLFVKTEPCDIASYPTHG